MEWKGGRSPAASPPVAAAFAATPFALVLRDARPDPSAVGRFEKDGFIVRTSDNIGQYCSQKLGQLLEQAGARLTETPQAVLEAELLEFQVVEGGKFVGSARIRATVRPVQGQPWTQTYSGRASTWGRTHSPENFNKALSGAFADVTAAMLKDPAFAHALAPSVVPPPTTNPAYPPPPQGAYPAPPPQGGYPVAPAPPPPQGGYPLAPAPPPPPKR
jgi:hypothetical protein